MNILPNGSLSTRRRFRDPETVASVAAVFAALGEPSRLAIVQQLRRGPLCVSELVARLEARQANVSKQLGVLYEAGLLGRRREGAQVRYFIADPLVLELCDAVCGTLVRGSGRRAGEAAPHRRGRARRR